MTINIKWKFVSTQPSMNVYKFFVYFGFKDCKIFVFVNQIGIIHK